MAPLNVKPLAPIDKRNAFVHAVTRYSGSRERWERRRHTAMNDSELSEALRYELGIAGGASAAGTTPSVSYQGAGLKIWADWRYANPHLSAPILQGCATVAMARDVFGIQQPNDHQMELF